MKIFRPSVTGLLTLSISNALRSRYQHRFRSRPQPAGKGGTAHPQVGEAQVCTSIIVTAELRYGAAKKGSPKLLSQLEAVIGALEILPFEKPADHTYGALRTRLELAGTPIGGNDLLIAAQALALGYTIVTDNNREFARVNNLRLENWLR